MKLSTRVLRYHKKVWYCRWAESDYYHVQKLPLIENSESAITKHEIKIKPSNLLQRIAVGRASVVENFSKSGYKTPPNRFNIHISETTEALSTKPYPCTLVPWKN